MITGDGWHRYNIWEHSESLRELYGRRCRLEEEEMTCHAQAAELLLPYVTPDDTLLDAGCGSGYFFHSLKKRNIPVEYYGIDASPSLIEIGRNLLPRHGLSPENLQTLRIEDMGGDVDHVVCINVLSNLDNYHRPLERLIKTARKTVILRESCGEANDYSYVRDGYLDEGCDLKVHVNTYCLREVMTFIAAYGFEVRNIVDLRTQGQPEFVIGYPHYWTFIVGERQ
jgi:SAM-dependent methyltransferase